MAFPIRAYSNADHAFVVWRPQRKINGCVGFALEREPAGGKPSPVDTCHGFPLQVADARLVRPSTEWPIADFAWVDYDVSEGDEVRYRAVPVIRRRGEVASDSRLASGWSNRVTITAAAGDPFRAYFNRGLLPTQWVAHRLREMLHAQTNGDMALGNNGPTPFNTTDARAVLRPAVATPGNALRGHLSRGLREPMLDLLEDAKRNRVNVYAALFLLNDRELLDALIALGPRARIILSDGRDIATPSPLPAGGDDQDSSAKRRDENEASRAALKAASPRPQLTSRMLKRGQLGHNKFVVICDKNDRPKRAWTGSGNWTVTGLCAQTNNGLLIEDARIAAAFKRQWDRLKEDSTKRDKDDDKPMSEALRRSNGRPQEWRIGSQRVKLWFAPLPLPEGSYEDEEGGEASDLASGAAPKEMPADLAEVRDLIEGAREAVLFLLYVPAERDGAGSIFDVIRAEAARRKKLYVRGVINGWLGEDPNVASLRRGGTVPLDPPIVVPRPVRRSANGLIEELDYYGNAITHSKVIVVDPFSSRPAVVTGAHNLGRKASLDNDENMLIIRNNKKLAEAYAVNVIGIYRHYRLRYRLSLLHRYPAARRSETELTAAPSDDRWQNLWLTPGSERHAELRHWLRK